MNALPSSSTAAAAAAALPLVPADPAAAILAAARLLLPRLERGERVDTAILRNAMEGAFGASDAIGAWDWKDAYDAGEAAAVLLLRKYGRVLFRTAPSPAARLSLLAKIAALLLPPGLRRLYVARDHDAEGLRAFERLKNRAEAAGVAEVWELVPAADDFNTDLTVRGREALALHLVPQLAQDDAVAHLHREAGALDAVA